MILCKNISIATFFVYITLRKQVWKTKHLSLLVKNWKCPFSSRHTFEIMTIKKETSLFLLL